MTKREHSTCESVNAMQISLQKAFRIKRDHVLKRLEEMGLPVEVPPTATFYIWLDLSRLSAPLNNGLTFFEELLKVGRLEVTDDRDCKTDSEQEKTICVPGLFFDINPSHRVSPPRLAKTVARTGLTGPSGTCSIRHATTSYDCHSVRPWRRWIRAWTPSSGC